MIRRFDAIWRSTCTGLVCLLLFATGAVAQAAGSQDARSGELQAWGRTDRGERQLGDFLGGSRDGTDVTYGLGPVPRISGTYAGSARSGRAPLPMGDMPGYLPPAGATPMPNEFQKFVAESTGTLLAIFGADFFSAANGYTPVQSVPVPSDYPLGAGDELLIRGWGSVDIDFRAVIDRDGLINIPKVGTVSLAGVPAGKAEDVIRVAIGKVFRGFSLNVTHGQLRGITVYVVGHARRPGTYTVSSLSTLITALFESGGPSPTGSSRHVQVKRAGKLVGEMDLYAFLARGDKSGDIKLLDGDVIVIPPASGYVALTGMIDVPAIYELRGTDDSIGSLLELAGGVPVVANPRRLIIERIDPERKQPRTVEEIQLDAAGLRTGLKSGDLISVLPISSEFANAVTLRVGDQGAFRLPLRLPFRLGMKITDVIPDRESLLSRAAVLRQNSYGRKPGVPNNESKAVIVGRDAKSARGSDKANTLGRLGSDEDRRRADQHEVAKVEERPSVSGHVPGDQYDEFSWDYAVVERLNRADLTVSLVPFNLGRALADPGGPENIPLQAGDTITVFSANDVRVPIAKRRVFVRIEGEVKQPGVYQAAPGESLVSLVLKAGGVTPDAYLFGTEFYRESVRKAQQENLDKLVRRLEQQMISESNRLVSRNVDAQAAIAAQGAQAVQAETRNHFIRNLRELKSSGRMSLGITALDSGLAQWPDLRLENGDKLIVPNRPDFVQVVGSVGTESSLVWFPGRSVSDYLAQSGVNRDADMDAAFVVRANGMVHSNADRWLSTITGLEVLPGDVIVVPERLDKEGFWTAFTRNAKDVTQIFYQLGLGAAAIKSLR